MVNIRRTEYRGLIERTRFFLIRSAPFCLIRRPAMTKEGWVGLVPMRAKAGDLMFLPLGAPVPIVVRPGFDGYTIQGECYIHGIMKGELMKGGQIRSEEITLV